MPVGVNKTTACSHGELSNIYQHGSNPAETVKDVMKDALTTAHYGHSPDGTMFSFYVFSVPVMKGEMTNAGDALAKFINGNGLGEVIETPAMTNKAYHPDHANKVYVWTVDHKAVAAWYRLQVIERSEANWFKLADEDFSDEIEEIDYEDDDEFDDDDDDEDDVEGDLDAANF